MYKFGNEKLWLSLNDKAAEQGLPLSTVVAEIMHLTSLDALFSLPESQHICFQGGTCIHLLHGGYRYSEDLDFVGSFIDQELTRRIVEKSRSTVEKGMAQLLGQGESEWRSPRKMPNPRVFTYWYLFRPQGLRVKFRLKIEFGQYPVYEPKAYPVMSELDLFNKRTLVMGTTPKELFIEKVMAVIGRPYFKGRDLFDVWYLSEVLKAPWDGELMAKKLRDYGEQLVWETVEEKLRNASPSLLSNEMNRFLPQRYRRQLEALGYREIRESVLSTMRKALSSVQT
ncbi:MAG: nucleotidyl transferase AbiEii/AbiGii toxin family protein [Candidatus Aminicenantes bacterium]|jgi:predicted nucleotidyltransferase component of viral defense system|nr:nucleotidyl transferase AbiEii/AbiGii toxin family protein [Candidatus Aminicenantes bacterium]MDH5385102.1 nucleotidyl transferase AbiEii/AbiGii toxin family protein [Candidatus Aminicenantes bacterium]MDH5744022.1 nucleotidyl transferase AbiEii/AbiGii toxin family protein [Candidatus Aminicenantes bacterium]